MKIQRVTACRLCQTESFESVLDFGNMALPKWPAACDDYVPSAPLELIVCTGCLLGQLRHSIDRVSLFRDYWYRTGVNATMRAHMRELADSARQQVHLAPGDLVVDIGCNDGTLLRSFEGHPSDVKIGIEPSNICPHDDAARWINDFFPTSSLDCGPGSAKLVTTMSMFYYVDDPLALAAEIVELLAPDGAWICEMNYAGAMLRDTTFDHISHEHVTVWSASNFVGTASQVGLEVFRIEQSPLNGGSIRFWCSWPGVHPVEPMVARILDAESGMVTLASYRIFADDVRKASRMLAEILEGYAARCEQVMVYGASTRGNTILAAAGVTDSLVAAAVERNPDKVGRYYGATGIPIISEEAMRSDMPKALLVLPYSFLGEFVEREGAFLDAGGHFIVPLPKPHVITRSSLAGTPR